VSSIMHRTVFFRWSKKLRSVISLCAVSFRFKIALRRTVLLAMCLLSTGALGLYHPPKASAALDPSLSQYWLSMGPIAGSTSASYTYASLFNPANSGKTIIAKRIRLNSDAVAAAVFQDLDLFRTSAASGGTQIAATNIPKKNTDSADSIADARYAGVTTTKVGTNDSRLMSVVAASAIGNANGGRDYTFNNNQLVLQPGEGIALGQTAVGDADQRIRMAVEWEESATTPASSDDFMLAFPRVENAGAVNYKFQTLMNPVGSGKTALISRLNLDVDCDTTAVFTNQIVIRRISAASAGTQIASANIPKKHTDGADSVMEARYSGVTATLSGVTDSVIDQVTPCGAANQPHAHDELTFGGTTENLVLQPGEGIALLEYSAGDIDQLVRLSAVWEEQATTPAAAAEYTQSIGPVTGVATSGYAYVSFFNPVGSGKTAVVDRVNVASDTIAAGSAVALTMQRISAASAGTQVLGSNVVKNNSGSANSVMEIRKASPTVTKVGTAAARMMTVDTPAAVGQLNGHFNRAFGGDQPLILAQGEGVVFYQEAAGSTNLRVNIGLQWDEEAAAPTNTGEYMMNAGPITGSTVSGYAYAAMMNPTGSGKNVVFHRLAVNLDATGTNVYVPMSVQRISAASAGTLIAASDTPAKNTATSASVVNVRTTGVTVTKTGGANARMNSVTTPGAAAAAGAPHVGGNSEYDYDNTEALVLKPGEGIVLYQEAAATTTMKVRFQMEWAELASAPTSQSEYTISTGPITGSTTSGYTYSSFLNPAGTGKSFIVKRIEVRADRTGTLTAPGYIPATVRRITASSVGTAITTTDIPVKNTSTATSLASIRMSNPTVTLANSADSRLMGVTTPGAVGQDSGLNTATIIDGDELVLAPGEGFALYQEAAAGDTLMTYRMRITWAEVTQPPTTYSQSAYRFLANADGVTPGAVLAAQDTAAIAPTAGTAFRLRTLLHVGATRVAVNTANFKLQTALRSGTCDTAFSGETYADVSAASGAIRYFNNTTPASNASIAAIGNDPAHGTDTTVPETYAEANNFANTQTALSPGDDAMWDFALVNNSASIGTAYCFRIVTSAGAVLDSYSVIPEIDIDSAPNNPTSLVQATTTDTMVSTGGWNNTQSIKFSAIGTDPDTNDTLALCVEKDAIATSFSNTEDLCGTAVPYSGATVTPAVTISGITDATEYHWQARLKDAAGVYSSWVSYDVNAETARDFGIDTTAPTGGTVFDGSGTGVDISFNTGSLTTLSANWSGISSNVSGLTKYEYSVGTSVGAIDTAGWTSTGTTPSMTNSTLSLQTSKMYYVNVRTTDGAGNVSTPVTSNGQLVPPSVSFSVSPSTVTFNHLKSSNSYIDTQTSTVTTTTNAYGGYLVRLYATDLLRAANNSTIGMFNGGTYAAPAVWSGGNTGFGYSSNDASIQGTTDKFGSAGCTTAATPSTCKFAPFSQAAPGDIVADHASGVIGATISGEAFTLTYRVTATATQAASDYKTAAVYTVTPIY
jgi:hypothetical protein